MPSSLSHYPLVPGPLQVTLVRHAQAEWVRAGLSVDSPALSPLGLTQARRLAEPLARSTFTRVDSSPMTRAMQTAELSGMDFVTQEWLAEIRYPNWEGHSAEAVNRALRASHESGYQSRWWPEDEGGESVKAFMSRVRGGLTQYLSALGVHPHAGEDPALWDIETAHQNLLLFGHAGTLATVLSCLLGFEPVPWEWERVQLPHASITRVTSFKVADAFAFSLVDCGDVQHLPVDEWTW